jgi:CRISPR-associated endonuclease/helicase Cas3
MTGELTADLFPAFFQAVHGVPPFPWQNRLLHQVAEGRGWPEVLDLPTGSGKTAALDVAVFHLAMEAQKGEHRCAALRIAFVVDRRLIVDDAYLRARKIEAALADAAAGGSTAEVLCTVAERLARLAERCERPLLARRLRGGVPREDDWARIPSQPTILCSTVDQVGSRLLFRGYGVSDRMKPVHAGLLGADCLILLDEAHLSEPFRQTLAGVAAHRKIHRDPGAPPPAPFAVALLTATPGKQPTEPFELSPEDRDHPVLRRRLIASKPALLAPMPVKRGESESAERIAAMADAVESALAHLAQQALLCQPAIGVVVNRVLRARRAYQQLRDAYGPVEEGQPPRADVELLIGPAREVDRADRVQQLTPIKTGETEARRELRRPLIVVATQTIEAGVDLDFDALITEIAPLDALRQRFGRLNRDGRDFRPYAVVLAHATDIRPGKDGDPVYGQAAAATWQALRDLAERDGGDTVDLAAEPQSGVAWVGALAPEEIESRGLLAGRENAPVLMPAYVDLWSQTWPAPAADPEPGLFLHGPERSPATVQIVWRADLERADLDRGHEGLDRTALLAAMPPKSGETVAVSLTAAREWLRLVDSEPTIADSDFADAPEQERDEDQPGAGARAFRWTGADNKRTGIIRPADVRPNDLIVVPAEYGGCDVFGWNPERKEPVTDVADRAARPFAAHRYALRLRPRLIAAVVPAGEDDEAAERARVLADDLPDLLAGWRDQPGNPKVSGLIRALRDARPPPFIDEALRNLESARGAVQPLWPYGEDGEGRPLGVVLLATKGIRRGMSDAAADLAGGDPATEDDWLGSTPGYEQALPQHSSEVSNMAGEFARKVGLGAETAADAALAGYLHDAGKADPRFQAMLYGGDWAAVDDARLLAKSTRRAPGAWARAGLPDQWRHEALSVRLAREHPRFQEANDRELVLWLIGVHHGYGRPLFPHADCRDALDRDDLRAIEGERLLLEGGAGPQSLAFDFDGWDWAQLFERLKRRYGVWELARLETIVRLADHRASEAAAQRADTEGTP